MIPLFLIISIKLIFYFIEALVFIVPCRWWLFGFPRSAGYKWVNSYNYHLTLVLKFDGFYGIREVPNINIKINIIIFFGGSIRYQ